MRLRRLSTVLAVGSTAATTFIAMAPAASAHVICDSGEFYRVTSHNATFLQVDAVQLVNTRSGTASLTAEVGTSHTSSNSFGGSITAGVEGGFWGFAKVSASATASVTIQTSTTMSSTYSATVSVPGYSTRTVKFGFRRYNQYIQRYHLYNDSISTCAASVDQAGWVDAPYMKAFIVS